MMSIIAPINRSRLSNRTLNVKFLLIVSILFGVISFITTSTFAGSKPSNEQDVINLRAWGVPHLFSSGTSDEIDRKIMEEFRRKYPWIYPVSTVGLKIGNSTRTMDMIPFMQIAGNIAPDVLAVNFRQSYYYINMKLLYPLDKYVEEFGEVELKNSSTLNNKEYIEALKNGRNWQAIESRILPQCWNVIRRECPYGNTCPYNEQWGCPAQENHMHVWSFPVRAMVMGLSYDRALFAEHVDEGIELRAPRDWEELLRWAKILTDPAANEYGLNISPDMPSWHFMSFLYSAGGRVVEKRSDKQWYCTLDNEEAVEAAYFFARLRFEKIERNGQVYRGVISSVDSTASGQIRYGMTFSYLDDKFFANAEQQTKGFGPVPVGPNGIRGSEFNSTTCGIFSGLANNERQRDAAWKYILFYDGQEARQIRTEKMVEAGLGDFVRPYLLREFNYEGRYDDILHRLPKEREETYRLAFAGGVPEPYGKNCQYVYNEMIKPLGAIWSNDIVREAIDTNNPDLAKGEIRAILKRATKRINHRMIGNLPPEVQKKRRVMAWITVIVVTIIFAMVFHKIFKAFTPDEAAIKGNWQFSRFKMAYLLMAPAVLSIGLWMYWPLLKGTIIAFQDYNVTGQSTWVGMKNFADVLYDSEFWYSLRISLIYALLFMVFGFGAPIVLAFLLQEVPRGKIFFRTIYYLPAVLTGVVVIFLWRSFYSGDGMINQVINGLIYVVNWLLYDLIPLLHSPIAQTHQNWLQNRTMVLFFCLLPTIWAGMGPGCLIYLAALKTVPEELYEASDIDGASIRDKVFYIAIPSIRALIMINFIGAMIGAIRGSGGFMLAMTGGGPFGEQGGATEVIGLKLFYTAFGYLKFGTAAAMAWVLGAMLIGFTVVQLRRLSKLEFRTAEKVK